MNSCKDVPCSWHCCQSCCYRKTQLFRFNHLTVLWYVLLLDCSKPLTLEWIVHPRKQLLQPKGTKNQSTFLFASNSPSYPLYSCAGTFGVEPHPSRPGQGSANHCAPMPQTSVALYELKRDRGEKEKQSERERK